MIQSEYDFGLDLTFFAGGVTWYMIYVIYPWHCIVTLQKEPVTSVSYPYNKYAATVDYQNYDHKVS